MNDSRVGEVWVMLATDKTFVVYHHELCHYKEEGKILDFAIRKCIDLQGDHSNVTLLFEFEDAPWESAASGMHKLL